VRLLFAGIEEEYRTSIETREDGRPFSLFFCGELPPTAELTGFDAIVIPALSLLAQPPLDVPVHLIASGSADLAGECFEAGCSDFIRVPWTESELFARVSAHTRKRLKLGGSGAAAIGGRLVGPAAELTLGADAYRMLMLLADNEGRSVPRAALASLLPAASQTSRSVDMRISRLRTALRSIGACDTADSLRCEHGAYHITC